MKQTHSSLNRNRVKVRHKINQDATSSGHNRISCICGANLVRQPFMNDADWKQATDIFHNAHK